jgi:hypothetical protein
VPERVVALIPPVPPGFDGDLTLIPTPAGTAFDPVAVAHSLAQEVVDGCCTRSAPRASCRSMRATRRTRR